MMVSESDAPSGRPASPWASTASAQPEGWFDYAAAYQGAQCAAREYAERSFADWSKSLAFAAQHEADWFDQINRAFAAWYAWWQAAYGIAPGVAPFAGGLNAWWWGSQNALPFAGVV
ncbi:polyketide synthase [Paraburkholderia sp. UYCP14C]|uniref:polyketide synthase n=1 Tax=Paraburkholderia sp. UYCP14C TaxID=2511130 RepID=UPI0010207DA0|nr:polyketide synthase [Paraburkholderia sp. UYCP14C]RZF27143.1 polyketide synthase [Paraburkholderia sp. UYCP14C]